LFSIELHNKTNSWSPSLQVFLLINFTVSCGDFT